MERVSIYIDGANFFGGLRSINEKYTDSKFDFERYIHKITKERKLIDVYYYNASLKQERNPEPFKKQQRLFERLRKMGVHVVLCRRQRRQGSDGEYFTIKGDDIHLAIDMLKDAYENKYDTAILISGDGDFAPLIRYVKQKGKKVENFHFAGNISYDLLNECVINACIDRKIVNKFFFREENTNVIGDMIPESEINKILDKK